MEQFLNFKAYFVLSALLKTPIFTASSTFSINSPQKLVRTAINNEIIATQTNIVKF